jgi:hypothetical protein
MDEHDYWEDEINRLEIEDMRKYCPGCPYWDDYYLCLGGSCIYDEN